MLSASATFLFNFDSNHILLNLGPPHGEHGGTTPKADSTPSNGGNDARSDLMAEIQKGKSSETTVGLLCGINFLDV